MFLLYICTVFVLLIISLSSSVPYPSSRCHENDCSFQFPDFKKDICKIYNTSVCLDFYNFKESSEETLRSEDESKFNVSVVPYIAELFVYPKSVVRSAINITFTVNSADIDELVIKISTKASSRPICRILDFQNVNISKHFPINLFYDCLFNMVEHRMENVLMDFIALPLKEKLSYYVFIPGTEYPGSCTWQSLIMVFSGSLQNGIVQVKFSQASELYNVSSYVIKLTENLSGNEKITDITPDISRSMLFAQFSSVDDGAYSVSVKPIIWGLHESCWAETDIFLVEKPKSDHRLIIYLCIFILLIFSALVFLKLFRRNIAKLRFGSKRRVLLLYSHDCKEHKDFVIAFVKYLIEHCHVEVFTIYGELPIVWISDEKPFNNAPIVNECNPLEWVKKKYNECDVIMFLISAGLYHTLDKKHSLPIQTYHEWRKQLLWATEFILLELVNGAENKKICKICFPHAGKEYIPDRLQLDCVKCYTFPQEMNNLINFMHDSGECFVCNKLCVTNYESSFENTNLFEKMRDVQVAVDNDSHIRIITPLSETFENDLNFTDLHDKSENVVEISTTSDSSDENSDSVSYILSPSMPKPLLKESFVNISSYGLSDYIRPIRESEDFFDESGSDSDSEDLNLCYPPKLYNENEASRVIEDIFNKNLT
ncbi:uncharacterized protein LOC129958140 [Argiope bruennichi]|uniref:SEFIR domain-containing protein n=1 Tax=Argiope bruennichi TaxID=94029 RepID=A0A8T0F5K7_ARGBR|nr:uncharacterized protein LOC129958140 [Argiope bruennichi]KAF8785598.1 hypothetical protein HNY73_011116 [Argiope bruennichi]